MNGTHFERVPGAACMDCGAAERKPCHVNRPGPLAGRLVVGVQVVTDGEAAAALVTSAIRRIDGVLALLAVHG